VGPFAYFETWLGGKNLTMATVIPDVEVAQQPQVGSDILVQCLIRNGVDTVFAYPGGASMPIHQSLVKFREQVRTILPRHEQGGIFAAEGYARATGKVGVAIATSGPGATNLVTGLADAKLDSVPVVAITGQVRTSVIGTDAFQETPTVEVCRAITKHHYLVTRIEDLSRVMKEAFHIASTGRPGPVIVDVPKDVQEGRIIPNFDPPMDLPGYRPYREASSRDLHRVIDAIRQSKRPTIYAGGGVISSGASAELRTFAEKTGIPVALTVMGLGCMPHNHYLCLNMLGMHGSVFANYAVNDADLLLAFGVRFDDRVTGKVEEFCKHGRIVHIDIDSSEIHKSKHAHIGVTSDLKFALQELIRLLDPSIGPCNWKNWLAQIDEWRATESIRYDDRDDCILPQYAIQRLSELSGASNTVVAVGVGQHQMWTAQHYKFTTPRTFLSSSGLGAMGFGLPAAMGAQAGCPTKTVIDIDGDGSFLMNVQELATIVCEKLPVKIFIINNQHLGMVVQWEDRFHGGVRGHTYLGPIDRPEAIGCGGAEISAPYPDFVKIAEGFGIPARHVRNKKELPEAIRRMLDSDGPYLLDVLVPYQEHVLPMIPSGKTVRDIIKS
jgi:acetolactate synthase I/II/III large subunit